VDIDQVFISPTFAYKAGEHNYLGAAVILPCSALPPRIAVIEPISSNPTKVTNNGYSYSSGAGVRIGWLGELNHVLSVRHWQSKTYVSKFSKYGGLFASKEDSIFHPTLPVGRP